MPDKSGARAQSLTVQIDAINIQLATLQQAIAYIDNKPITPQSAMLLSNQPDKLTFDI